MDSRTQKGYLILADISGYTQFMAGTELEHSQAILSDILDGIIGIFTPTLNLAEVEGDAVFSYVSEGKIPRGETILELIEVTYIAFRDRRETMNLRTSCSCKACKAIPTLDLKFVTHFGEYILHTVGKNLKPMGSDVNLVHRLLKNSVSHATGWKAYALFTTKSLEKMGLRLDRGHTQAEQYEHLGDVDTFSIDLHARYKDLTDQRRILVTPEDAYAMITQDFPASPPITWGWLTEPQKRNLWIKGTQWSAVVRPGGRTGPGARNHCAHGKSVTVEHILDWRPFEYYTVEQNAGPIVFIITERIEPISGGTRLTACAKIKTSLPTWFARVFCRFILKVFKVEQGYKTMARLIAEGEAGAH
jgi:hypothetical protein